MKNNYFKILCLFIFCFVLSGLHAQIVPLTGVEPQNFYCPVAVKDTVNKIYIHGRVVQKQNPKIGMTRAVIQLKGKDNYAAADSLGYYWLDVTGIGKVSKKNIIQCSFVNHATKEVIITHKITKTLVINFELELSGGIAPPEMSKPAKKK